MPSVSDPDPDSVGPLDLAWESGIWTQMQADKNYPKKRRNMEA
jgi:hypothetical protein